MKRIVALFAAAVVPAILSPRAGTAQTPPDTVRLSEMVVTATRLPLPLNAVPASVTVIDGRSLRDAGVRYVTDALRQVPGLAVVQSGSAGGLTSVFVRGGESDYVMVLVDGVQINDPGGAVDLAHLTTDDIERIEVVRGPTSVLYGSDAASGVIQVFTRRGSDVPVVHGTIGVGRSRRTGAGASGPTPSLHAGAGIAGAVAGLGYALSASRHSTEGAYAFNNDYDNTTLGGQFGIGAAGGTNARLTARYVDGSFHFPTNGAGELVDANQFRRSESLALGFEAGHNLSDGVRAGISVKARDGDYHIDDVPDGPADTLGGYALDVVDVLTRRSTDLWFDVRPATAMTLTVGAAAEWQTARNTTLSESSFGPYESASDNERRNRALYGQLVAAAAPALTVTAGGRIDDNDRFGTFPSYRAGLNWAPRAGLRLRASAGTGFKEPTFYENYATGFVNGNPDLEPERTRSLELGVEKGLVHDRLTLNVTAFTQQFRNLIQFTFAPPRGTSNYFNVGEATARGLEFSARWSSTGGVTAAAGWDVLHTEVGDEGFGADRSFLLGQPLLRRPRHSGTLSVGYATARWNSSILISHTGSRDDLDFSDPTEFDGLRTTLDAYTTVDISAELAVLRSRTEDGIAIIARIDNLFDRRYEEVSNFPAARRAIYLGIRSRIRP